MTDILERLRKVEPDLPGDRTRWYRNPDGPEAAAEIEKLREERNRLQEALQWIADRDWKLENNPARQINGPFAEIALAALKEKD